MRFSDNETAEFFNQKMNLKLSLEEINILKNRTEGWVAGLQLAGLSMKSRKDISSFVNTFAGNDRYIVDYLVEDVLNRQAAEIQNFLLQTSVLSRLSGPLCDYVTNVPGSQSMLDELESANLFIIPLDNKRKWYRYHYLFADLLQERLKNTQSDAVRLLHLRASEWYENNGFDEFAIEHALAVKDYDLSSRLIQKMADKVWKKGEISKMFKWFEILPKDNISTKPKLCVLYSWLLVKNGQYEKAENYLKFATKITEVRIESLSTELGDVLPAELKELRGLTALVYASMASINENEFKVFEYAEKALSFIPSEDLVARGCALLISAKALYQKQDLGESIKIFSEVREIAKKIQNKNLYIEPVWPMIAIYKFCGQFNKVIETYKQLLEIVSEEELAQTLVGASILVLWGDVLQKQNKLDEALHYSTIGVNVLEQGIDVGTLCIAYFIQLKIFGAIKDDSSAKKLIKKMEELENDNDLPLWEKGRSQAQIASYWLKKGELEKVSLYIEKNKFKIDEEKVAYRLPGLMLFARYLVEQDRSEEAIKLVESILEILKIPDGNEFQLEVILIKTSAYHKLGNRDESLKTLSEALTLSENCGSISFFLNEGKHISDLLENIRNSDIQISQSYVEEILTAFGQTKTFETEIGFIDQLSVREMEVLRLMAEGKSNNEISEQLFIALSTVKTHVRKIYRKLNVHNRIEASIKAKELNLL